MPRKFKRRWWTKYQKNRIRWWVGGAAIAIFVAMISGIGMLKPLPASAVNECPKLRIVFARGSGGVRWEDKNYLDFVQWIDSKLETSGWSKEDYEFIDLDYPAMGLDIENFWEVLGAYFGAGDSYQFGKSVDTGVKNLVEMVNNTCPNTKYALGGYSQGAMVISKSIHSIPANKIIYAATFGDPKLYLPEGQGLFPAACRGEKLSDYRAYVPDCHANEGMLGSYKPYQPLGYSGKLGTWCNGLDIFCSSGLNLLDHLAYYNENTDKDLYRDASKVIVAKINEEFEIENNYVSPHDTVFLIDSTSSMRSLIFRYKHEALNLAQETLEKGGRVALYDYRDAGGGYEPNEWCTFETCTIEKFKESLNNITVEGGGDEPESLLSASFKVMKRLDWRYGATKSVVVLTDATFHNPDVDGVTFTDVVKLSKSIDPVNFYIITTPEKTGSYKDLAEATDGEVALSTSDLSILTRKIINRYDSLPRVEESDNTEALPEISDAKFENIAIDRVRVSWRNTGIKTIVALNDLVLGTTDANEIIIEDVDFSRENIVRLVPVSETRRGERVEIALENGVTVPRAPDTGRYE